MAHPRRQKGSSDLLIPQPQAGRLGALPPISAESGTSNTNCWLTLVANALGYSPGSKRSLPCPAVWKEACAGGARRQAFGCNALAVTLSVELTFARRPAGFSGPLQAQQIGL